MKPGNIKTDLGIGRTHQVEEVPSLEPKPRVEVERSPELVKSQLPEAPSSRTDSHGESPIVQAHIRARQEEARKGKRQKLLKVAEAKTLAKAARAAFKALADLMGRAASILERFARKLFDEDEEEGEQQKRRRQHEESIEEVEELKIDPSEVPRGLKPLTT